METPSSLPTAIVVSSASEVVPQAESPIVNCTPQEALGLLVYRAEMLRGQVEPLLKELEGVLRQINLLESGEAVTNLTLPLHHLSSNAVRYPNWFAQRYLDAPH